MQYTARKKVASNILCANEYSLSRAKIDESFLLRTDPN
jgi:hypothetical protein